MAEDVTFSTPVAADAGATRWRIAWLWLHWQDARVTVALRDWDGTTWGSRHMQVVYEGAVATTMMQGLNKVNLSTRSLHQRVLDRLIVDGKVPAGSVAGTVD